MILILILVWVLLLLLVVVMLLLLVMLLLAVSTNRLKSVDAAGSCRFPQVGMGEARTYRAASAGASYTRRDQKT